jgi:N-acetylneuraminate synthase
MGAVMIEKHFTLDRSEGGVDAAFSIQPDELTELVYESEKAWQSLGEVSYGPTESEIESVPFRRSLYITQDMKAGEKLTKENLRSIRPGLGLKPKYYVELLGCPVVVDVKRGTPMRWELVK